MSGAKKSILSVLFRFKCPQCRQGDLFIKPFSFNKAFSMRENCSICNLNYNPEPGFYFGAMFISYIITAWVYVILAGIVMYFFDFSVDEAIWTVVIFAALTFVYFFRLGRSVWLAINVKYKDNAGDNKNPQNHIK